MNEPKVIKTERVGEAFKVIKQTEELLDITALVNRKNSLQYQIADYKKQIKHMRSMYDAAEAEIAECDSMIATLSASEPLPEIEK
jgi:hypothetical protein